MSSKAIQTKAVKIIKTTSRGCAIIEVYRSHKTPSQKQHIQKRHLAETTILSNAVCKSHMLRMEINNKFTLQFYIFCPSKRKQRTGEGKKINKIKLIPKNDMSYFPFVGKRHHLPRGHILFGFSGFGTYNTLKMTSSEITRCHRFKK